MLNIPNTWAAAKPAGQKKILILKNESHEKIQNDGRTQGKKRKINKIHPDLGTAYAELFAKPTAYTKSMALKPILNFTYHITKLGKYQLLLNA